MRATSRKNETDVHSRPAQPETLLSQSVTPSCSSTFAGLQQWPFLVALSSGTPQRGQRALKEISMVIGPGPSCADIAADYCWRKFHKVQMEMPSVKRRPTAVGCRRSARSHWKNSRSAAHWTTVADRRTAWQKSPCPHSQGSISKAMKGLVCGAAAGQAERRTHWTTALIPWRSGRGTSTNTAPPQAARAAWGGVERARARQNRNLIASRVKLAPISAPCGC